MTLLLISAGGALGAVARYRLGILMYRKEKHTFPFGTFVINISGALLLGLLCGAGISGSPYVLLGDGFCGAFTTFSTFTVETVQLLRDYASKKAVCFVALSFAAGMLCFAAGYWTANFLVAGFSIF